MADVNAVNRNVSIMLLPIVRQRVLIFSGNCVIIRKNKACGDSFAWLRFDTAMTITVSLGEIPVELLLNHGDYLPTYSQFATAQPPLGQVCAFPDAQRHYPTLAQDSPYAEHMELCLRLSDFLLDYGRVFFHGVAFVWREKAWILTAPPETGKTTLFLFWKLCCGDAVRILNGDKPILALDDGTFTVHPSPWNGKENLGNLISAPLGGIVLLKRGAQNRMERVLHGAAVPIYSQFLYSAIKPAALDAVCAMEDALLRTVPVWELTSCGDLDSAELCRAGLEEVLP